MTFADRISAENRKKKWAIFLEAVKPDAELTILDVGFNAREYSSVDNYLEKHYPWQHQITALGIESPGGFGSLYPHVKAIQYDGNLFPFCDKSFDVCWSNAVIEHVGDAAAQESFLREIARVSDFAFVTTPNRTFPIEVHTRVPLLHFLPKGIFDAFLKMIGKKWATGDYMNLMSRKELEMRLRAAGVDDYTIIPNRKFGFVMDFVVMFGSLSGSRKPTLDSENSV